MKLTLIFCLLVSIALILYVNEINCDKVFFYFLLFTVLFF